MTLVIENILGAGDAGVDVSCVFLIEPGHPKICNLRNPFLIKQNVASLDVPVDDAVWCVLMEIEQSSSNASYDLKPLLPVYLRSSIGFCIQKQKPILLNYAKVQTNLDTKLKMRRKENLLKRTLSRLSLATYS